VWRRNEKGVGVAIERLQVRLLVGHCCTTTLGNLVQVSVSPSSVIWSGQEAVMLFGWENNWQKAVTAYRWVYDQAICRLTAK